MLKILVARPIKSNNLAVNLSYNSCTKNVPSGICYFSRSFLFPILIFLSSLNLVRYWCERINSIFRQSYIENVR